MKKKYLIILVLSLYFSLKTIRVYGADYEYDDLGRVIKVVYEDGSSVTYTYDANGNIVEVITGTEWENEEENEADSSESGMSSGGEQEGGNRSGGQDGSGKENKKDEEKHQEDGAESIEGQVGKHQEDGAESIEGQEENEGNEGNEAKETKEKESDRTENVIAGILATLGIAALILIWRLKNGNWNITGTGKGNQGGDKDGRNTKENREDREAE